MRPFFRLVPTIVLAGVLAGMAGCEGYISESDIAQDQIIQLDTVIPAEGLVANGADTLTLRVTMDEETATTRSVVVTASDGVVNFAADPGDATARTIAVNPAPGAEMDGTDTKVIELPMVVGRTPGQIFVTASLEGIQSQKVVTVDPAPPTTLLLTTSATALNLDGTSRADITATLLREDGEVSLGTRIQFAVCCEQPGGTLALCQPRDPLRVSPLAELERDRTLQVTAVAESIDAIEAGTTEPFGAAVLARPLGDTPLACGDADAVVSRIRVTPRAP